MKFSVAIASEADAPELAALRTAVADDLTRRFGAGHWSGAVTEKSVLQTMKASRVLLARARSRIIATLRLATKKPWAIDRTYFTDAARPLYLLDMAVAPKRQDQGIGRHMLEEAKSCAIAWPADAIRLDAYDHAAGAGGFYAACGFREVGRVTYRGVPLVYFELLL